MSSLGKRVIGSYISSHFIYTMYNEFKNMLFKRQHIYVGIFL